MNSLLLAQSTNEAFDHSGQPSDLLWMAHAGQVLIDQFCLLVDCGHVYGVLIAAWLRALMIFAVALV